jgi:hypothetical protein
VERSGVGWQRYLLNRVGVDWRLKENNRFRDQTQKPWLHLHQGRDHPEATLLKFIGELRIRVLNVAGPRASKEPEVRGFCKASASVSREKYVVQ